MDRFSVGLGIHWIDSLLSILLPLGTIFSIISVPLSGIAVGVMKFAIAVKYNQDMQYCNNLETSEAELSGILHISTKEFIYASYVLYMSGTKIML